MYVVGGKRTTIQKMRRSSTGQAVVEYAGALVIAAGIIAASIIIVPPSFAGFIDSVYTSMTTYLMAQMPK